MRPIPVFLAAFFVVACGATAQVVTSPTPGPSGVPTIAPSDVPTITPATDSPTPVGSPTPIPLTTPTPIALNSPTPSVSPTASPSSSPTNGPDNGPFGPFAKIDSFPTSDAFEVTDVTVAPGGYVAVGFGGLNGAGYDGLRQGIVWTSVDGVNWVETFDPSLVNVSPEFVVSKGSDLILAGTLATCAESDDSCTDVPQTGIWRSTNGGAWELLPAPPEMQSGVIYNMFLAGDQLVVYGGAGDAQTMTVWLSQDGATWTSSTNLAGMETVTSMAVGPAGFSAFGTIYDDAAQDVVLLATTSADGQHFTPATAPQLNGAGIEALVAGPSGMVGVGSVSTDFFNDSGLAVHSTDGLSWTQATNTDGSFGGSSLSRVHALPAGGYVALGYIPRTDDSFLDDGAAWFSADGTDWALIARLDGGFSNLDTSAVGAGGVIVFAAEQTVLPNDDAGSVVHAWFAPLASIHG